MKSVMALGAKNGTYYSVNVKERHRVARTGMRNHD
jgi:hypothetical protein